MYLVWPIWIVFFVKTIYDKFIKEKEVDQDDDNAKQEEHEFTLNDINQDMNDMNQYESGFRSMEH